MGAWSLADDLKCFQEDADIQFRDKSRLTRVSRFSWFRSQHIVKKFVNILDPQTRSSPRRARRVWRAWGWWFLLSRGSSCVHRRWCWDWVATRRILCHGQVEAVDWLVQSRQSQTGNAFPSDWRSRPALDLESWAASLPCNLDIVIGSTGRVDCNSLVHSCAWTSDPSKRNSSSPNTSHHDIFQGCVFYRSRSRVGSWSSTCTGAVWWINNGDKGMLVDSIANVSLSNSVTSGHTELFFCIVLKCPARQLDFWRFCLLPRSLCSIACSGPHWFRPVHSEG